MPEFERITRLPPYVFNITSMRRLARSAGALASADLPAPRARSERKGETMIMRTAMHEYRSVQRGGIQMKTIRNGIRRLARSAGAH
jgi:hypothetical protein